MTRAALNMDIDDGIGQIAEILYSLQSYTISADS